MFLPASGIAIIVVHEERTHPSEAELTAFVVVLLSVLVVVTSKESPSKALRHRCDSLSALSHLWLSIVHLDCHCRGVGAKMVYFN